jgi:hypothetical protein
MLSPAPEIGLMAKAVAGSISRVDETTAISLPVIVGNEVVHSTSPAR